MSEANRVVVQEGYVLPFQAYRPRRADLSTKAGRREDEGVRRREGRGVGRGRGRKSAAYLAQQSKMKKCAGEWRNRGRGGNYRAFMSACLKKKR